VVVVGGSVALGGGAVGVVGVLGALGVAGVPCDGACCGVRVRGGRRLLPLDRRRVAALCGAFRAANRGATPAEAVEAEAADTAARRFRCLRLCRRAAR